jgi:hypothetical protein
VSLNQLLYLAGLERTTATTPQMFIVAGPAITPANPCDVGGGKRGGSWAIAIQQMTPRL